MANPKKIPTHVPANSAIIPLAAAQSAQHLALLPVPLLQAQPRVPLPVRSLALSYLARRHRSSAVSSARSPVKASPRTSTPPPKMPTGKKTIRPVITSLKTPITV